MYEGKWTALTVRKTFFEYFEQRGHTIGALEQPCHPNQELLLSWGTWARLVHSIEPS
jgi:alanyl-tRNA synthetase